MIWKNLKVMMIIWRSVLGFIGYKCGSNAVNMTTISLLDIEDCDQGDEEIISTSTEEIVLLQLNEFNFVDTIQCKVEITRIIYRCGMFSHVSIVDNGFLEYIHYTSREACQNAHSFGSLRIGNTIINNLSPNTTTIRSIKLAGSLERDGTCAGGEYSEDENNNWSNVVVIAKARITLKSLSVRVKLDNNKAYFPSGHGCALTKGWCLDPEGGYSYWAPLPISNCPRNSFSVLFAGAASIVTTKRESVYAVNIKDTTFALATAGTTESCGLQLTRTEHPKLFFIANNKLPMLSKNPHIQIDADNMDIFLYINSKILFVERFIRQNIKSLYKEVMLHRCKLEREVLKNSLAIASIAPDEFAYRFMKGPGYMSVLAGEVIHIVQCSPVEVKIRPVEECWDRLPITLGNDSYFLIPKTHIVTTHATQISCNSPLHQYQRLGNTWYKMTPKLVETVPPVEIKPNVKGTWSYKSPAYLATSGIYSEHDLESIRNRIMYPIESTPILQNIVNKITSFKHDGEVSVVDLFDDKALEKMAENVWEKTWGRFMVFGTASAGLIGIFMVLRIFKLMIDTIIHGYALHKVYGFSIHLIGALWDSVTNFLLHFATRPTKKPESTDEELPLNSIATAPQELRTENTQQNNPVYPPLQPIQSSRGEFLN